MAEEKTSSLLAMESAAGEGTVIEHDAAESHLRKHLKDRHLSMIALGGALGTGLLVGT